MFIYKDCVMMVTMWFIDSLFGKNQQQHRPSDFLQKSSFALPQPHTTYGNVVSLTGHVVDFSFGKSLLN